MGSILEDDGDDGDVNIVNKLNIIYTQLTTGFRQYYRQIYVLKSINALCNLQF